MSVIVNPSAGAAIGFPIVGGVNNEVLFINGSGNLAQSPNFTYHGITTGDFNTLNMGTDGAIILQAGNLNPGTGGSESSTILAMSDGIVVNPITTIEGGLTFGASFNLDDSEGQFDFVTTQNGDPRLDMWGFINAQINFTCLDPTGHGTDQGSPAANVAWQKANSPARITVDGDLYAAKTSPNRYGRNLNLTAESNNNGGTGGDISFTPGAGDTGQLNGAVLVNSQTNDGTGAVIQVHGDNRGTTIYGGSSFYLGGGAGLIADPNAVVQYTSDSNATNVWYNIGGGATNATFGFVSGGTFKSGITYSNGNGIWLTDNGAAGFPSTGIFVADGGGAVTVTTAATFNDAVILSSGDFTITNGDMHINNYILDHAANPGSNGDVLTVVSGSGIIWKSPVSAKLTSVVDVVSLTNQSADIGSTNLTNSNVAGLYRVSYALEDTTSAVGAGAVTLTIAYTDGAGAATQASAAQLLSGVGRTQGSYFIQLASGSISYSTSHTGIFSTSKYALYVTSERLS